MAYSLPNSHGIPVEAWTLPFTTDDPNIQVSLPNVLDTIKLLPMARRVVSG